ncbi:MAG: STAS domain-containing protein [Magnetococcales bacterium]|nr:STAS domain-containing protein [Magnetococcales bacterium]MBF0437521.1 STAS domain-containing protein [Magnetococcales bacterium]
MGITVREVQEPESECVLMIDLSGTFDYEVNREFLTIFKNRDDLKSMPIIINCSLVQHVDSAALGMLLMLREKAGGVDSNVTIVGCNTNLKRIFGAAHFDRLFKFA